MASASGLITYFDKTILKATTEQEKALYARNAELQLGESRKKLALVLWKLKAGIARGEIERTEQLSSARRRVRACLKAVVMYVTDLKVQRGDAWETSREGIEDAWEELAKSVRGLVTQINARPISGNPGTASHRGDQ